MPPGDADGDAATAATCVDLDDSAATLVATADGAADYVLTFAGRSCSRWPAPAA